MILLLLIGIGVALYLLIGLLLLSWIDYDYDLFHFIVGWPVPILELVLLFGWPVVLSAYGWRRRGWCADDASSQGSGAQNAPASSHRRSGVGAGSRSARATTSRCLLALADTRSSSHTSQESEASAAASSLVGEDRRRESAWMRPRGHRSSRHG